MGKRASVMKRGKDGVPIRGEKKDSEQKATPKSTNKARNKKGLQGRNIPIRYEKNSDGSGTVKVGKGTVALLDGSDDVTTWTDKELMQGYRDGTRRPPNMIPRGVYDELSKRLVQKAQFWHAADLELAMKKHSAIVAAINPKRVSMVQWLALKEIYERVLGSPEQHVVHSLDSESWKEVVANAIVPTEATIIDVEVADDDNAVDETL